jgi:hypothetical protein
MSQVAAVFTPCTAAEMFSALADAWRAKFGAEPKRASILVLLSQWAEETGRGKYCRCANVGNIKWVAGDPHDYCSFRCDEVIGGKVVWFDPPHPACNFRAYASLVAGVRDYLDLLVSRFASAWPFVLAGDPMGFAQALHRARYMTADPNVYGTALVSLVHEFDRTIPLEAPLPAKPTGDVAELQRLATLANDIDAGEEGLPDDEPPEAA